MPVSQKRASPERCAANRANAARSTGPRSPEGKTRSAQNARKHGFAAEAYTVVRFEDLHDLANLKDDLVDFYQPVNSQELFAVERMALAQHSILRIARLEAGLFTSCLNEACGLTEIPRAQLDPLLTADTEVTRVQNRNFVMGEGFQHSAANSNALSLCLRYAAHAERQYRRAVEEFDRLKALRPPSTAAGLAGGIDQTNPTPSEAPQSQELAPVPPGALPRSVQCDGPGVTGQVADRACPAPTPPAADGFSDKGEASRWPLQG